MTSIIIQFYAIVSRREGGCTTFACKCHVSTRVVLMFGSSIRRKLSLGVGTEEVLISFAVRVAAGNSLQSESLLWAQFQRFHTGSIGQTTQISPWKSRKDFVLLRPIP